VELKYRIKENIGASSIGLNRTKVELKWRPDDRASGPAPSLNRTKVELKYIGENALMSVKLV